MFHKILIEKQIQDHPRTLHILQELAKFNIPTLTIDKVEDIFGRVRKPYLQKRTNLNLFLGRKEGELVKEAPPAYGTSGVPHYYFLHAFNCIYECQYCYLQGYFSSPDIVLFVNHEEICAEIYRISLQHQKEIWFHAGEFSDSLALAHLTNEWSLYWELFKKIPWARLELRTKSVNISPILDLPPQQNIIVSFSLAPTLQAKTYDLKVPSLQARLKAMARLQQQGHPVAIHLDPIIYNENFQEHFTLLLQEMRGQLDFSLISYVSLGVVRFTKDVYRQVQLNYPHSPLSYADMVKSFDGKVRYPRPVRSWILQQVHHLCVEAGLTAQQLYFCMED